MAARGPRRVSAQQLEAYRTLSIITAPSRPHARQRDAVDAVPHPAFDGRRGALPAHGLDLLAADAVEA